MADKKMLRGKAPLTMYRGAGGVGGNVYRGSVVDPRLIDATDRERLVREMFLEWVVGDGESWKLAEDTDDGKAGDPVTVGDTGLVDPSDRDPGNVNVNVEADSTSDPAVEQKRADAKAKLAELGGTPDGRASNEVLVEYLVGKGYDRAELEKSDRAELRKLVADAK